MSMSYAILLTTESFPVFLFLLFLALRRINCCNATQLFLSLAPSENTVYRLTVCLQLVCPHETTETFRISGTRGEICLK